MRACVFSDIHGNGPAFRAASGAIRRQAADLNIFLGDLCGYYFDQLEVFALLRELPGLVALRGNHDQIFLDILAGDEALRHQYAERYGSSMENLLASDHIELAEWLASLPLSRREADGRFLCCHGSPAENLEGYVYPDTPLALPAEAGEYLLLGHTHYRMARDVEGTAVINPGSLGQPRDGLAPSFVVVDLAVRQFQYHEVRYDRESVKRQLAERGETNGYLLAVLDRVAV